MKMLVVCAYGLYQNFRSSFIHAQIREFVKAGHQVCVLVPIALGKRDWDGKRIGAAARCEDGATIFPVRYISLSKYGRRGFNTWNALLSLWCAIHFAGKEMFCPDVVYAHTLGFSSTLGAWLKRRFQCPLIVTTHGSDTSIPAAQGKWRELKQWSDAADCVVAVSTSLAKKVQASGTQTPVTVILNGYNRENLRKASGGSKEPISIIYVGHLIQQKQVHITIQAFAQIHWRYPEATMTIVGSGPERQVLENLCKELNVSNAVHFLGEVPNSVVFEQLGKCQFFVMPSVREGFGIVYLEAMASGCLTIGTEGEGIADLIKSGFNGFLVPPACPTAITEKIVWCIEHKEQAEQIAEAGCRSAMKLTWEKNATAYCEIFQKIKRSIR